MEINDMIGKAANEVVVNIMQDVSYKFSDLIESYPDFLSVLALAAAQSCINAQLPHMLEKERQLYDLVLQRTSVMILPRSMDPRQYESGAET